MFFSIQNKQSIFCEYNYNSRMTTMVFSSTFVCMSVCISIPHVSLTKSNIVVTYVT